MNTLSKYGTVVALTLAVASHANAGIVQGELFNTGLDSSNMLIAGSTTDANWTASKPQGSSAVAFFHPAYAANDDDSQWISTDVNGGTSTRNAVFSTTFDLTGYNAATAMITGLWGVDNYATIFLNGNTTNVALEFGESAFNKLTEFTISGGFKSGLNELTVELTNGYFNDFTRAPGPLALRFDNLELTADVPEPGTLALLGLGLVGLGFSRRKKV